MLKACTGVPWEIRLEGLRQSEGGLVGSSEAALSSTACELGFYKSAPGDQLCARCPLHSHSAAPAAQACRCDLSYYRASLDPPSAACTREYCPAPRNPGDQKQARTPCSQTLGSQDSGGDIGTGGFLGSGASLGLGGDSNSASLVGVPTLTFLGVPTSCHTSPATSPQGNLFFLPSVFPSCFRGPMRVALVIS